MIGIVRIAKRKGNGNRMLNQIGEGEMPIRKSELRKYIKAVVEDIFQKEPSDLNQREMATLKLNLMERIRHGELDDVVFSRLEEILKEFKDTIIIKGDD